MRWVAILGTLLGAICLTACNKTGSVSIADMSVEDARRALSGRTYHISDGTRTYYDNAPSGSRSLLRMESGANVIVNYLSPDGASYYWRTKATTVPKITWKIIKAEGEQGYQNAICFDNVEYPKYRTFQSGSKGTICQYVKDFLGSTNDQMKGDPFELETKRLPYQMFQEELDMAAMLQKAKDLRPPPAKKQDRQLRAALAPISHFTNRSGN